MFKVFVNILLGMILGSLKKVALETIEGLNSESITNDDKRRLAFNTLKEAAIKEGRALRDSLLNLAIELAVAYLKKKNG